MRALDGAEPEEISRLELPRDADFDHNGTLMTDELDRYIKQTMPMIAAQFPTLVANRRSAAGNQSPEIPTDRLAQESRVQTVTTSFPLVPIDEVAAPPR
jgi:hypothetical protein